jgi:diphthamide biosynthesis protein 2
LTSPPGSYQPGASTEASKVLTRRAKGDLVTVNGMASPGAEYLRNQRTWQGLGSDFAATEASLEIEEGRSGVARGYTVGEDRERR